MGYYLTCDSFGYVHTLPYTAEPVAAEQYVAQAVSGHFSLTSQKLCSLGVLGRKSSEIWAKENLFSP